VQSPTQARVEVRVLANDEHELGNPDGSGHNKIENAQSPAHPQKQLLGLTAGGVRGLRAQHWKQFNVKQQNLTFQLTQQMRLQQESTRGNLGGTIVNSGFSLQSNIDSAQKLQKLIERKQMAVACGQVQ